MDPNRISALYHQALARAPDERGAFLRAACEGDESLRREVESLLQCEPAAFLEAPAAVVAAGVAERVPMIGRRLGPYEIVAPLGAGGMGRSTERATRNWVAMWRSRSCRSNSRPIRNGARGSGVKRVCSPRSITRTSARFTDWKKWMA